jgi:hypothetical protein
MSEGVSFLEDERQGMGDRSRIRIIREREEGR